MVRATGLFVPFIREFGEILYQLEAPFVVDTSKFARTFGPTATTPHRTAVARTVEWFQRRLQAHNKEGES